MNALGIFRFLTVSMITAKSDNTKNMAKTAIDGNSGALGVGFELLFGGCVITGVGVA